MTNFATKTERFLAILVFALIVFGVLAAFAQVVKAEDHVFSTGLDLQGTIAAGEDSKVSEASYRGYISGIIDILWLGAAADCTGTPDFDTIETGVITVLNGTKDSRLAVTPAWGVIGIAIHLAYPACFTDTNEVKI